jgi:uncharacterized membrane protein
MVSSIPRSRTLRLALATISTALVCVATIVFSIYVPATRGFFNIGETVIFTTSLVLGPSVGAFAGGVGASLADLLLGYWYYAPATLVIKAFEGATVGFIGRKKTPLKSRSLWKVCAVGIGIVIGVLLALIGSLKYSGILELSLGVPSYTLTIPVFVPWEFWYLLGGLVAVLISLSGFLLEPDIGLRALATLLGGSVMVIGYFLYQSFLLLPLFGIEVVAIGEIPFNIAQMLIGSIVALPAARILLRSLPQLSNQAHEPQKARQ